MKYGLYYLTGHKYIISTLEYYNSEVEMIYIVYIVSRKFIVAIPVRNP